MTPELTSLQKKIITVTLLAEIKRLYDYADKYPDGGASIEATHKFQTDAEKIIALLNNY